MKGERKVENLVECSAAAGVAVSVIEMVAEMVDD